MGTFAVSLGSRHVLKKPLKMSSAARVRKAFAALKTSTYCADNFSDKMDAKRMTAIATLKAVARICVGNTSKVHIWADSQAKHRQAELNVPQATACAVEHESAQYKFYFGLPLTAFTLVETRFNLKSSKFFTAYGFANYSRSHNSQPCDQHVSGRASAQASQGRQQRSLDKEADHKASAPPNMINEKDGQHLKNWFFARGQLLNDTSWQGIVSVGHRCHTCLLKMREERLATSKVVIHKIGTLILCSHIKKKKKNIYIYIHKLRGVQPWKGVTAGH